MISIDLSNFTFKEILINYLGFAHKLTGAGFFILRLR